MHRLAAASLIAALLAAPAFGQELFPAGEVGLRGVVDTGPSRDDVATSMQLRLDSASSRQAAGAAQPLSLRGALATAGQASPAVQAAQLRAKAANIGVWRSIADFVPTIEAGYDHTISFEQGGTPVSLEDPGDYLSLTATVPLFTGGQRYHRLQGARAEAEAARHDAAGVRDDVTEQILGAWVTLASADQAIEVLGSSRARVQELKNAVAAQEGKGFASRDELALVAADLASIDQSIAMASIRRDQARNVIRRHTGHAPDGRLRLPSLEHHLPDEPSSLISAAHRHSPALRAASARYRSERATTRAAFGQNLPQVNLTGQARYDTRPSTQSDERTSWRVGVDVRIPLVNASNWAQTAQQQVLTEAALAREADALRATEQRIFDLWSEFNAGDWTIEAMRSQVENRHLAAIAANRRFRQGFEQLAGAVALEREAKDAALALAEAEASHQLTMARLLLTAGLFDMSMIRD